jgi:hypothetical protein
MQIGSSFALPVSGFRCEQRHQWKWLASEQHHRSAGDWPTAAAAGGTLEHRTCRMAGKQGRKVGGPTYTALFSLVLVVVSFKEKSRCSSSAAAPS